MSSSTSSFRRWLIIFFTLVMSVPIPFLAASEWMLRTYILPVDGFEQILRKLTESSIPNAALGDSHAAAVYDFSDKDFINFGLGGTTIRQMSERAHFYFSKINPGKIIIEADSHLFAEYRLVAHGAHIPESYATHRLAVFNERHRRFMLDYWDRYIAEGLKPKESHRPDQLWQTTNGLATSETLQPAPSSQPGPEPASSPPDSVPAAQAQTDIRSNAAGAAETTSPPDSVRQPEPPSPPKETERGTTTETSQPAPSSQPGSQPASVPVAQAQADIPNNAAGSVPAVSSKDASADEAKQRKEEALRAEFNTFMDYIARTHTPVSDFQQRDEARIYVEMLDFLISRGATVCLMSYPVDRFYRERADRIAMYAEVKEFYKKLAKDRGIRYVSFYARFDDPEMFQNTDHVNPKGSAILAVEARRACFSDK